MFGSSTFGGGGGFGQPQQQQQSTGFGATPFGGGGGFGQQPQQQPQQGGFGSSPFGSTAAAPVGFGQQPPAASPFGSTGGGGFGQQTNTFGGGSGFGAPAPAGGGLFGATPAPSTFGAAPTAFGSNPAGGGGLFSTNNAPNTGGSLFGAPAPSATPFGGTGGFGATTGGFGATSTFGAAPSGFGAPTTSLFGASPAPAPFGAAPAPSQGGLFGAPAPTGGLFGAAPAQQPQGQGTRTTPWQPTSRQDGSTNISIHAISAMPQYEANSAEELRVQDYQQGNRGSTTPTASNTSGAFGFGAAPAPAFGAAPAPTGLFGAAPAPGAFGAPSAFGAPAPAGGGLFGSTTSTFGAPAPAPGGLFGSPAPAAFGAPAPGGLFGSTPAPTFGAPAPTSGGLFGAPAPAPFGAPSTSPFGAPAPSAFGAPAPASGGLFGSAPAPSAFGSPFGAAPAPSTGLFGSAPAPAFGAPAFGFGAKPPGTGLFGSPAPAPAPFGSTFGSFGQPPSPYGAPSPYGVPPGNQYGAPPAAQQQQPAIPQNSIIIPPVQSEVLEIQLRALNMAREELEKKQFPSMGGGARNGTSPSTPTNFSDRGGRWPAASPVKYTYTPQSGGGSAVKIRPRGVFPKTEPKRTSKPIALGMFQAAASTRTPVEHARSSNTQLVIRPTNRNPLKLRLESSFPASPGNGNNRQGGRSVGFSSPGEDLTSPPHHDDMTPARRSSPEPADRSDEKLPSSRQYDSVNGGGEARPPKSPAHEYYQRVIGAGEESSFAATPTAAAATPRENKTLNNSVPKLSKMGYTSSPTIEELAEMSEADLAAVEGFAVKRPSYGKIEWEGAVDVRGADLDAIIGIEQSDISVYHDSEMNGSKPPVGSKLNRPAILTFYSVFPKKGGAAASEADKKKLREKLETVTKKSGAKFLSYDDKMGEWKIRVQHFSRYGLFDDDSEADEDDLGNTSNIVEEENYPTASRRVRIETPAGASSVKKARMDARQATPYKPVGRYSICDEDDEMDAGNVEDEDDEEEDNDNEEMSRENVRDLMSESDIFKVVKANADMAYRKVFEAVKNTPKSTPRKESPMRSKLLAEKITFEDEGDDDSLDGEDDQEDTPVYPVRTFLEPETPGPSPCEALAQKAKMNNCVHDQGYRMGRSFGVAWLPNGSFLKLDPQSSLRQPSLVKCKPVFVEDASLRNADCLLQSQLRCVTNVNDEDDECPLFSLPRGSDNIGSSSSNEDLYEALKDFAAQNVDNLDSAPAFNLMSELLFATENDSTTALTVFGDSVKSKIPMGTRAITAVTNWLVNLCAEDVDEEIERVKRRGDHQNAIFAALSSGDLEKACDVAMNVGAFELATLLSSSSEGRSDILQQVLQMIDSGDSSRVGPGAIRCLKAVGGDSYSESDLFKKGVSALDWRRHLAIRLLQNSDGALEDVLAMFTKDIEQGQVPSPLPMYCREGQSTNQSLLFKLLCKLSDPGSFDVSDIVDPKGFTYSVHDFSMSFHLAAALSAMASSGAMGVLFCEELLHGYESQLINCGLWEWAIFVALYIPVAATNGIVPVKVRRAKEMILRYFDATPNSKAKREFLVNEVGIPPVWFEEALAGRCAYDGDLNGAIAHTFEYDFIQTVNILEVHFLPKIFFMEKDAIEGCMRANKRLATNAAPDSLVAALDRYIRLDQERATLSQTVGHDVSTKLVTLIRECDQVVGMFLRYRSRPRSGLGIGLPGTSTESELREMIATAVQNLKLMKEELECHAATLGILH